MGFNSELGKNTYINTYFNLSTFFYFFCFLEVSTASKNAANSFIVTGPTPILDRILLGSFKNARNSSAVVS